MKLSNVERMLIFNAIEESIFKMQMKIRDLKVMKETDRNVEAHLRLIEEDFDILVQLRDRIQIEIEMNNLKYKKGDTK